QSKTINVYKDARGTILSMSDILFETGKADLKPELKENLAAIAAILQSLLTESKVIVEGHTDNVGSEQINQFLSDKRALSVLDYLVERGVNRDRLESVGHGLSRPVADNNTEEGRAKNRRVELVIKD
ncbi:MAG: OmpA family protein, partial [Candidatus Fibromonas sp.]|nr:OmpA family protein [Candidatus Fibromonas sp.]